MTTPGSAFQDEEQAVRSRTSLLVRQETVSSESELFRHSSKFARIRNLPAAETNDGGSESSPFVAEPARQFVSSPPLLCDRVKSKETRSFHLLWPPSGLQEVMLHEKGLWQPIPWSVTGDGTLSSCSHSDDGICCSLETTEGDNVLMRSAEESFAFSIVS